MDGSGEENSNPAASSGGSVPPVPHWNTSSTATVWPRNVDVITPSTAPLLEVSDLPEPGDMSAAAVHPSVNGEDPTSAASTEEVHTDPTFSLAETDMHTSVTASSSGPGAASTSVVTAVTGGESVDSSDPQVAAEEMVGVEELTAAPSDLVAGSSAEEGVMVEAPAVSSDDRLKESTDVSGSEEGVVPATASGDWLCKCIISLLSLCTFLSFFSH
jgi:hypothetical protein